MSTDTIKTEISVQQQQENCLQQQQQLTEQLDVTAAAASGSATRKSRGLLPFRDAFSFPGYDDDYHAVDACASSYDVIVLLLIWYIYQPVLKSTSPY